MVIDGGHEEETAYLLSVLRALSPDPAHIRIEAWLMTHLHVDHFGALLTLLREEETANFLEIGHVYMTLLDEKFYTTLGREPYSAAPEICHDLLTLPKRLGASVHTVADGDEFAVDELRFRALHVPKMADAALMDINDSSVVWRLSVAGGKTVLFLADAEFVCSNDLLARCRADLPADIVQVGHHGCGNVSRAVYEAIGAKLYLWQIGHRFWYSDKGEGLGTHNTAFLGRAPGSMRWECRPKPLSEMIEGLLGCACEAWTQQREIMGKGDLAKSPLPARVWDRGPHLLLCPRCIFQPDKIALIVRTDGTNFWRLDAGVDVAAVEAEPGAGRVGGEKLGLLHPVGQLAEAFAVGLFDGGNSW